jgi:hypothetical protein
VSRQVDLIYRSIFFSPFEKLDESVFLRNVGNRTDNWIAWTDAEYIGISKSVANEGGNIPFGPGNFFNPRGTP